MTVAWRQGECRTVLATLPAQSVHCVVTSPPYWGLRDYGVHEDGGIGLEATFAEWLTNMVNVMRGVWRVLRDDGTLWLNMGDAYAGGGYANHDINGPEWKRAFTGDKRRSRQQNLKRMNPQFKPKDLIGQPWRLALALQQPWYVCRGCHAEHHVSQWGQWPDGRHICPTCTKSRGVEISQPGWYLRADIIWHKPNPMPESVQDRPTKSHEYVFLLTKQPRYFYDAEAMREAVDYEYLKYRWGGNLFRTEGNGLDTIQRSLPTGKARTLGVNPAGRNKRSVWTIATQPYSAAHFATFPPALVEPCIQAGTSSHGCCAACGAPWRRVVVKSGEWRAQHERIGKHTGEIYRLNPGGGIAGPKTTRSSTTTGWEPGCTCDAGLIPCTVLDPFGGAGTTALVADRLGRHAISIELSAEYMALAQERLRTETPLLQQDRPVDDEPPEGFEQLLLFA